MSMRPYAHCKTHSALPVGNIHGANASPGGVPFRFHVPIQNVSFLVRLYPSTRAVNADWTESDTGSNRMTGR